MRTSIRALVRPVLAANLPVGLQRFWLEAATALGPAAPGVVRDVGLLGARPAEIHTPAHRADRSILYLHGGAFTLGSPRTHRALCSHLAAATSARVYVLDYRRAPEHPFPAALEVRRRSRSSETPPEGGLPWLPHWPWIRPVRWGSSRRGST
jgi:monoterpene epsilon-lactone hydrolase